MSARHSKVSRYRRDRERHGSTHARCQRMAAGVVVKNERSHLSRTSETRIPFRSLKCASHDWTDEIEHAQTKHHTVSPPTEVCLGKSRTK
jgi:hypothetical protein